MVEQRYVGLLGATSLVGHYLLPMLIREGFKVVAYSRRLEIQTIDGVAWRRPGAGPVATSRQPPISLWICVAPIWVLPEYFEILKSAGAEHIVALSSTSRFSKDSSTDTAERKLAQRLTDAEIHLQTWAIDSGIKWTILRPTLIYGLGRDKNIAEIARMIRRFGIFPVFGKAQGLRQPIHAEDVAKACLAALQLPQTVNKAYNISGGETLSHRDMVIRIFTSLGQRPRLITVPLWIFSIAVTVLRIMPRYRHWSTAMVERMNKDLVFDHSDAVRDLHFKPRPFVLTAEDLPN